MGIDFKPENMLEKAIVLGILLKEAETPTLMKDFSYDVRVHYANLMLKIVSGKKFPADLQ